jgi:DNA polymerase III epsilon subunit-like protein
MSAPLAFPEPLRRIVVVDLETSGLGPECGILQIGAVPLDPTRGIEAFTRNVRLEWWKEWQEGAQQVHGITRAEAEDPRRMPDYEAVEDFLLWIEDHVLADIKGRALIAGMNPAFDLGFLRRVAEQADLKERFEGLISHRTVDMHTLAVAKHWAEPGLDLDRLQTDKIYDLLGMLAEPRPHVAITGAELERLAIQRLLIGSLLPA